MKQIDQIYHHVNQMTAQQLSDNSLEQLSELGSNALDVAIDLALNRANVSKELNKLWREGRLFKIDGRPTYFVPYEAIKQIYPDLFFASYYSSFDDLLNSLNHFNVNEEDDFNTSLTTLSNLQEQLFVALSYPLPGYPPMIQFETGINNYKFVKDVFNSLKEKDILNKRYQFKYIECSNSSSKDFINFFENELDFQSSKSTSNTFFFINQIDLLQDFEIIKLNRFFTNLRWLENTHHNKYVLGLPSTSDPSIINVFSTVITTTPFQDLSMLDRLHYIIESFKENAIKLQMNIRIQRELFKAFCFNEIEANYQVIDNDITTALIKSHARALKEERHSCVLLWSDFSFPLIHESIPKHISLNIIDSYFDDMIQFDSTGNSKIDYIYNQPIINELNGIIMKTDFNQKESIKDMIEIYSNRIKRALNHELQALTIHSGYSQFNTDKIHGNEREIGFDFLVTQLNTLSLSNFNPTNIEFLQEVYQQSFQKSSVTTTGLLLIIDSRHNEDTYHNLLKPHQIPYHILSIKVPITIDALNEVLNHFEETSDIVIVTDINIYQNTESLLQGVSDRNILSYYPLSLPLVEDLINKIEKNITLDELRKDKRGFLMENTSSETQLNNKENIFLRQLTDDFLIKQLTFLDGTKAVNVLYPILTNILNNLKLSHTKQFVVKFIVHSAFVIERCIKKEFLEYPDLNLFLKENGETISIVEKEFVKVEETFGIKIPLSELAYISDIFIQS